MDTVLAFSVLCLLLQLPGGRSQSQDSQERLFWREANSHLAVCNDFTRAGFFLRRNPSSDRWVIYLEGGSLCFSADTCNVRFYNSEFRTADGSGEPSISFENPFGDVRPEDIAERVRVAGTPYSDYINPLVTSMKCLNPDLFEDGFSVNGFDILNATDDQNPFQDHNHVVIPYCSSDLWLGTEVLSERECNCSDLECFEYEPSAERLQFAFRGRIIFETIFRQLLTEFGMSSAESIVLAGSSAGGVGVLNLAQWARGVMPASSDMFVILDSAWFINFQDAIFRVFDGTVSGNFTDIERDNNQRLFGIINNNTACADMSLGYPCCVSAHCIMTARNDSGSLAYYPENASTFVLSSVYDVFLLAPSLAGLADFDAIEGGAEQAQSATGLVIDFLRIVGEYGGEMNFTLNQVFQTTDFFSFYLTQCFQHIYFATSSLWGDEETTVFGSLSINLAEDLVSFSHSIAPGRWTFPLSNNNITIRSAIHSWYLTATTPTRYTDICQGPYCNDQCPDGFILGELTSNNWPLWARIVIAVLLVGIAVVCLLTKVAFTVWLYRLERKQDAYLDSLDDLVDAKLVFPDCSDDNKVSVSCLDLTYSVTYATKNLKDERKDQTQAVVLNDLTEQAEAEAEDQGLAGGPEGWRRSRRLRRRNRLSHFAETLLGTQQQRPTSTIVSSPSTLEDPEAGISMSPFTKPPPTPPPPPPLPSFPPPDDDDTYNSLGCRTRKTKHILKGISIYFNPGEMIGIMGSSGCGKTTLLDLLTGRRRIGSIGGDIYVNGIPLETIRDWYIANTGYVLQLATPYYEELTVRDNLTLAAQIKLPETKKFTYKDKFKRVEQVMEITGLISLADTVVGGETGPGLSGGQKRRLVVALQLLKLPSVIFLDEPTSGLDATSSMELLIHLNKLALTKRTVILTIHQPRFEIFHMFHKLVLLSDGQVAYHGIPDRAYEVFVNALRDRYLESGLVIPSLQDHNPADVIMDMLGNSRFRRILTEYYQDSEEPRLVKHAVKVARWREYSESTTSIDSIGAALFGGKKVGQRHAHTFTRMAAMEARGVKRIVLTQLMFLPMVFFIFALVLGTVYIQASSPFLIVSGMCVFSVASGLFVFPAIELYYTPAIRVYTYERADGVGRSQDLVLQGFARYISIAFLPVVVSSGVIYLLVIDHVAYNVLVFLQVALVNVALNLCWTALLISLMLAIPKTAFRLSSGIASVFGFTSGFFIPINNIPWVYRWIAFINPNYYGFSSVAFFLLEDFDLCEGTELECYLSSGAFTLRMFNFDKINPYMHLAILLGFTLFYLLLAMFVNWLRHTSVLLKFRRLITVLFRKPTDALSQQIKSDKAGYVRSISTATSLDQDDEEEEEEDDDEYSEDVSHDEDDVTTPLFTIPEGEEEAVENEVKLEKEAQLDECPVGTPQLKAKKKWQFAAKKTIEESPVNGGTSEEAAAPSGWNRVRMVRITDNPERPSNLKLPRKRSSLKKPPAKTPFLSDGQSHKVWRPKQRPQLANLVEMLQKQESVPEPPQPQPAEPKSASPATPKTPRDSIASTNLLTPGASRQLSLRSRQKTLFNRVLATQAFLKERNDKLLTQPEESVQLQTKKPKQMTLLEATKKVTANLKKQKSEEESTKNFSDIVTQLLATKAKEEEGEEPESATEAPRKASSLNRPGAKGRPEMKRRETKGAIPLSALREIVKEEHLQPAGSPDDPGLKRHSTGGVAFASAASVTPPTTPASATEHNRPMKMNKLTQLKKTVAERNQQREMNGSDEDLAGSHTSLPAITLNTNNNNNESRVSSAPARHSVGNVQIMEDVTYISPSPSGRMGSRAVSTPDTKVKVKGILKGSGRDALDSGSIALATDSPRTRASRSSSSPRRWAHTSSPRISRSPEQRANTSPGVPRSSPQASHSPGLSGAIFVVPEENEARSKRQRWSEMEDNTMEGTMDDEDIGLLYDTSETDL